MFSLQMSHIVITCDGHWAESWVYQCIQYAFRVSVSHLHKFIIRLHNEHKQSLRWIVTSRSVGYDATVLNEHWSRVTCVCVCFVSASSNKNTRKKTVKKPSPTYNVFGGTLNLALSI